MQSYCGNESFSNIPTLQWLFNLTLSIIGEDCADGFVCLLLKKQQQQQQQCGTAGSFFSCEGERGWGFCSLLSTSEW